MKRTTKYVFLDVHQDTTVGAVREESGRIIARPIVPTEASALVGLFGEMRGTKHVVFEEGTQAQWLYELLCPVVDRVLVCGRRGEKRAGNKGDKLDANRGSELLRQGALGAVYHGGGEHARLKELARTYANVVADHTRVMLRLKSLFRARGIKAAGKREACAALLRVECYAPRAVTDACAQVVSISAAGASIVRARPLQGSGAEAAEQASHDLPRK